MNNKEIIVIEKNGKKTFKNVKTFARYIYLKMNRPSDEEWEPIEKFPDYFVHETGKVCNSKGRNMQARPIGRRGYLAVRICRNGKTKILYIHRLVAEAFVPNPLNKPVVNHIDGNKLNNDFTNLEWVTWSENLQHAYDLGLRKPNSRRNSGMFKKGSNVNPKSMEKGGTNEPRIKI